MKYLFIDNIFKLPYGVKIKKKQRGQKTTNSALIISYSLNKETDYTSKNKQTRVL